MAGETKKFSDNVRALRKERHLTQEAFAEKAGISLSCLQKIEHGESSPTIEIISKIRLALDVPLERLMLTKKEYETLLKANKLRGATDSFSFLSDFLKAFGQRPPTLQKVILCLTFLDPECLKDISGERLRAVQSLLAIGE